jgi:endonuclease/exonuclease/phosphatase family metal-dependent hydrolase
LAGSTSLLASTPVVRFTAATYNVHKCVGMDIRTDPERIAGVVREIDADVIGLQEVNNRSGGSHFAAQADYIAGVTGYHTLLGPTIMRPEGHYGNVLLSRRPILKSSRIDLTFSGREPRGAIDALLEIGGVRVRVIVSHLGLAAAERWNQICRLAELIESHSFEPLVLMGDLNEWYPRSRGLHLLHREMGRAPSTPSYPAWCPFLSLDRIWVRPRASLIHVRAHSTPASRVASDHLPVVAEIAFA